MECRAVVGIVYGPEFSSMRGNNRAANRKAKPHSFLLRGEERLKNIFDLFLWDAAAAVRDGYNNCAAGVLDSSTNAQPALRSVAIGHRVTSVDHQIDQNLLKLHRIAGDGRQIRRELRIHGDLLIYEIGADQLQDIAYNFVYTERTLLHFAFFKPQAQPTDHFCGVLVFAYDVIKNFAHLWEVGIAVCEHPLR